MNYFEAKEHHFQMIRASISMLKMSLVLLQDKLFARENSVEELQRVWNEQKNIMAVLQDEYQALRELQGRG